jgi:hypothetical protein
MPNPNAKPLELLLKAYLTFPHIAG